MSEVIVSDSVLQRTSSELEVFPPEILGKMQSTYSDF